MMLLRKTSTTPEIKNVKGNVYPDSIACLEKVKLGNVDQWIQIRGCSRHNPILLFLHGGPGAAQISFARPFQSKLEKRFVVVNWDQRGAGKSFSEQLLGTPMNIEQFVSDCHELVLMLIQRFNRVKIYIAGHSWGSVVGLIAAKRFPELFYAYIGIGQVVDVQEMGRILYKYNYNAARKANNKKALKELGDLGFPPALNDKDAIIKQIKWLERFGGVYGKKDIKKIIFRSALLSPEYTLHEKLNYYAASWFCFSKVLDELYTVNFFKQIPEVNIPVYFCIGRHDYNTPFELSERYFNILKAPKKDFIWFDKSGHAPHFEEPDKFTKVLVSRVLAETYK